MIAVLRISPYSLNPHANVVLDRLHPSDCSNSGRRISHLQIESDSTKACEYLVVRILCIALVAEDRGLFEVSCNVRILREFDEQSQ